MIEKKELSKEKFISINSSENITCNTNSDSRVLRAIIITGNEKKFEEFRSQLGDGYGMNVQQWKPNNSNELNQDTLNDICIDIMKTQKYSPHFILRENTQLISRKTKRELTNLPLEQLRPLESVLHVSQLNVYKPQWGAATKSNDTPASAKQLTGFTQRNYEQRSYGYIKRGDTTASCKLGFGWDALFVNSATNLTNEEFYEKFGKKSARQHTISNFIETYLRYKALVTLKHHNLPLQRPIDFGDNYFHLTDFVKLEKHLSNPFIHEWGIEKLRNAQINQGLFVKAAYSRPVKNYFSPPFSGLPLTAKKDDAEETIFLTHDMLHHAIPDLVCDIPKSKGGFNVYSAWRMTSEACTLIFADMLYADGLVKSGVDRSCVDKRIYPLFEAIKKAQQLPNPAQMTLQEKVDFIRKLLFANVRYALLGDDGEWQRLLRQADGTISEKHLACLTAYKNHFGKFFIGDNAWTRANFDNMYANSQPLTNWINSVGKESFRQANIPLLSEICVSLSAENNDLNNYECVVNQVFETIFATRIKPTLEQENVIFDNNKEIQSRAFRRFMIGQVSIFYRYPVPPNLDKIPEQILQKLQGDQLLSNDDQNEIRALFEQYILGLEGLRLMSFEESLNAIDCSPVFPPVYISYPEMQKKYTSIENCVKLCIEDYDIPTVKLSENNHLFFNNAAGCEKNNTAAQPSNTMSI